MAQLPAPPFQAPLPRSAGERPGEGAISLYDRFAALYAAYRLHVFPDDRAEIAAALDLGGARHVAELGCGPGFYATAFAAADPALHVMGIDRAPAQIAIARRRAAAQGVMNARFIIADAQALGSFARGLFDRIVASRLLMVVDDPDAVLAAARRVLAPGGILLIAEPIGPETGMLAMLRRMVHDAAGEVSEYIEPFVERHFTARAFRALVASQPWASVAIWEANGYRYARCRTCVSADCAVRRTYP
jgi:ubiquinone/menaquinone biosynthesis C-methylase UbiE